MNSGHASNMVYGGVRILRHRNSQPSETLADQHAQVCGWGDHDCVPCSISYKDSACCLSLHVNRRSESQAKKQRQHASTLAIVLLSSSLHDQGRPALVSARVRSRHNMG